MSLNFRQQWIAKVNSLDATRPDFANGYDVTAYPVGAVVRTAQTSSTINVDAGHSFRVGDKYLLNPGVDNTFSGTDTVQSVTATTIVMGQSVTVVVGDTLVNLGPDTGTSSPEYDASPLPIYSDADGTTAISNSRVTASAAGEYSYYHRGDGRFWELIRDGDGTVVDCVRGFGALPERYNVCDFGAAADATAGDTASIQATIDAGESTGLEVFFPPYEYNLNTGLTVDDNVVLRSTGGWRKPGATLMKQADVVGLTVSGIAAQGTVIDGIMIDGTDSPQSDDTAHGFLIKSKCVFRGQAKANGGHGLHLLASSASDNLNQSVIEGVFDANGAQGLHVEDTSNPASPDTNVLFYHVQSINNTGHGVQISTGIDHSGFIEADNNTGKGVYFEFTAGALNQNHDLFIYTEGNAGQDITVETGVKNVTLKARYTTIAIPNTSGILVKDGWSGHRQGAPGAELMDIAVWSNTAATDNAAKGITHKVWGSGNDELARWDYKGTGVVDFITDSASARSAGVNYGKYSFQGGGFQFTTANEAKWLLGQLSEEITLNTGGTTTDSVADLLPSNSIIEAVVARVTTGIVTATDWSLGDSDFATRFTDANATLVAGTLDVGVNQHTARELDGSATFNPTSLADGVGETLTPITVTGAALGDFVLISAPYDLQGITCNGYVSASDTVTVRLQNETTGTINLDSGTWRARVINLKQAVLTDKVQVNSAKLRITTTGTPSAGVVRVTVFYRRFVAPAS